MPLSIPCRHNPILQKVVERVNRDQELEQLWRCVNINAVDRSNISDHGEVHVRIVANIALRLLRLLNEAGIEMSVVENYACTVEDAEVIVVLAACLHDLGMAIHRQSHEETGLALAYPKAKELLLDLYDIPTRTIMVSEILHAVLAHHWDAACLTLEAGIVKVADALDMTKGRSRIPFQAGVTNIHSVSASAIDEITLAKGEDKPILVEIAMSNSAGIFQVDELLRRKLANSSIAPYVKIIARIEGETERRLVELYTL